MFTPRFVTLVECDLPEPPHALVVDFLMCTVAIYGGVRKQPLWKVPFTRDAFWDFIDATTTGETRFIPGAGGELILAIPASPLLPMISDGIFVANLPAAFTEGIAQMLKVSPELSLELDESRRHREPGRGIGFGNLSLQRRIRILPPDAGRPPPF